MTTFHESVWAPLDPCDDDTWKARVTRDLRGADFTRRLVSQTRDGIEIQPLYVATDAPIPAPGQSPWIRGFEANREPTWVIATRTTHPDPEHARQTIATDVERGVESVELHFDSAVRSAFGAAVGDGLAVNSALGLARVLEGIDLASTRVALDAGKSSVAVAGALLSVAERTRVAASELRGRLGFAPLDALAEFGGSAEDGRGLISDTVRAAATLAHEAPGLSSLTARAGAVHAAGATPALELGWMIASIVEMMREAERQGALEAVAARLCYDVSVGRDVFVEVARLRALRALHGRVIELLELGLTPPWIVARTSPRTYSARDPWVNMLRATAETFAGVVGGCAEMVVHAYEEPLVHATSLGRRVARNTQLILRAESHLAQVADPAGGSAYVESLTSQLSERGWSWFQQIEAEGGAFAVLESGWMADRIDEQASEEARLVSKRRIPVTGLNEFPNLAEETPNVESIDAAALAKIWSAQTTPQPQLAESAKRARDAAANDAERVAFLLSTAAHALPWQDLVQAGEPAFEGLDARSEGAPFEALRDAADGFAATHGSPPAVVVLTLGPLAEHNARTTWCQNALAAGGIHAVPINTGDATSLTAALEAHSTTAVLISGSDSRYADELDPAVELARQAGAKWVAIAGKRSELPEGVSGTLRFGMDLHAFLSDLLDTLEANR